MILKNADGIKNKTPGGNLPSNSLLYTEDTLKDMLKTMLFFSPIKNKLIYYAKCRGKYERKVGVKDILS